MISMVCVYTTTATDRMTTFQYVVLIIASLILIISLSIIGYILNMKSTNSTFPPSQNTCPDGWRLAPLGENMNGYLSNNAASSATCIFKTATSTTSNLGTLIPDKFTPGIITKSGTLANDPIGIDFANSYYVNGRGSILCNKKNWANKYGIQWDGVTNNNSC